MNQMPRSTRATLEHYAAEAALARQARKTPRRTEIVWWVDTPDGPRFDTFEGACTAGPGTVGFSEIRRLSR